MASDDIINEIFQKIREQISLTNQVLNDRGFDINCIEPEEFHQYITSHAPSGDLTTIEDVLDNRYLVIHEVVEISELKKMNIPVGFRTTGNYPFEVYIAHIVAFELELTIAKDEGNQDWINNRINLVDSWLEDESMPRKLIQKCNDLKDKYIT